MHVLTEMPVFHFTPSTQGGNWQTEYGHFYLAWYSGHLVGHADRILGAAAAVLNKPGRPRLLNKMVEVRGCGWW